MGDKKVTYLLFRLIYFLKILGNRLLSCDVTNWSGGQVHWIYGNCQNAGWLIVNRFVILELNHVTQKLTENSVFFSVSKK